MVVKYRYQKAIKHINIFQFKVLQNIPKVDFWYANVPSGKPGGDIMITFLRFLPIFAEEIGVFLKNQHYDQIFGKNIFKNHNIGPWSKPW
jgi:hypothetical protein